MYRGPGWSEARGGPRPILDFEFFRGSLDSRITFTRSTSGTHFNSAGVLATAAVNIPRFDHKPSDSNATLGLLLEEARTNLCLQSEDLSTTWLATRCSVVTNQAAAPDGTTTMDKVIGLEVPVAFANVSQAIVSEGSTQYSFSAFLKKSTSIKMLFLIAATSASWDKTVNFDTGALEAGSNTAPNAARIEDVGGGIYRVTITVTTGVADLTLTPTAYIIPDGGSWASNSGVNDGFLMWGMQVEKGAFSSSYIPTTTVSVARTADLATLTLANTGFVQSIASYFVEMDFASSASTLTGQWALSVSDDSANNAHDLALDDGTESVPRFYVFSGGSAIGNVAITGVAEKTLFKVAWAVKENDLSATINGGTITQDSTVTPMPTGMTKLKIGRRGNDGQNFTGHIRKLQIYNARLPDGVLVELTR